MKTKNLFLGMMAGLFMVACSNEDVPTPADNNMVANADEQYVGVKFSMEGNPSSRALGGFENGTAAEVAVNKATFFFLASDGSVAATPYTLSGNFTSWTASNADAVDQESTAIVVIRNAVKNPASIVVVLNSPEDYPQGKTLAELEAMQGTNYAGIGENKFVMTNSVYANGNKKALATPITDAHIKKTEEDAKNAAVVVPVERVLAKVTFDKGNVAGEETIKLDPASSSEEGTSTKIDVVIKGWNLSYTNDNSYLFKNVDPAWTYNWWNDAANKRSYWAISANPKNGYGLDSWPTGLHADGIYCQENTTAVVGNRTKVVVSAELQINGTPTSLLKYNGSFYTVDNFKKAVANAYNTIEVNDNGTVRPLKAEDLVLEYNTATDDPVYVSASSTDPIKDYQALVTLKDGLTSDDLATLRGIVALFWNEGKTYFYTDIAHEGGLYGVVRNHLYNLTLTEVEGLGTPVTDPDNPIDPEKPDPEDESYIAAQIQILKYKVVTQNVTLN
ncbi:MAG: hypothetical protein E7096_03440 [Bacteroides sp.]|nr:hypothetical protein [Bacteroides sp.]